jgi:alpha-tubulin suppressor-like RCC1 family protein
VTLIGWVFIPFLVIGAAPNWWSQRGVLNPNASPDDYAWANQGQLKNIATAAVAEFDEHLPGGAGDTLHSLVNGWNQPNAQRNDFAPVNLGQLKNAVRSFYDRLIAIGYADTYPWTGAPNPPDDFAIANIGQVKNLFSFDLLATDIVHDSDQNGLPDWWEKYYFGNTGVDPNGDVDGDGRSNFEEFLHGTDPNDYYNGVVSELTIVGGDDQLGDPSSVLSLPLVVRATRGGQPLVNAPIEFRVPADSGLFSRSPNNDPFLNTIIIRTSASGSATAYFRLPATPSVAIPISISAGQASAAMSAHTNAGHETNGPIMSIISGNNQVGLPGKYLQDPFVVRLLDGDGQPIVGVGITFSINSGAGKVATDRFTSPASTSVTLLSDNEGLGWAYYAQGSTPGMSSDVTAAISNPAAQASFLATSVSYGPTTPRCVAVGESHTLACYSDGTVWAWGDNTYGQLGDGTTARSWHRVRVADLTNVIAVSTHKNTSAALRSDGTVWTWGSNEEYALGDGGSDDSAMPVQVQQDAGTPLTNVVAIASGYSHNLALKADGTVWAWGADWGYQLGNDSEEDSSFAVPVLMPDGTALDNVAAIACGADHNLALKSDGSVWTWGYNWEGELGTGESDWRRANPASIVGLTNVVAIAGGAAHGLTLKSDGTIWSWGQDSEGSLGYGTVGGKQRTPAQVRNLTSVIAIAAADVHSLALKSDGTVWAWGGNSDGQLGLATSLQQNFTQSNAAEVVAVAPPANSPLPAQTAGLAGIIAVAAGGYQSFAVSASGELLGWGSNGVGELGNRPQTDDGFFPRAVADFLLVEDADHDGLVTWKELKLGSNPNAYSTAGDNISDGWKAIYGLSLTDLTLATADLIGKGLTTLQDFQIGTDPTKFSTVDDDIADGWKVGYQLDPLDRALADEDPTGKGWTVRTDYQLGTDPTRTSTLNDGIPDKWKVDHRVNPLDSSYAGRDDDNDGLTNAEEYALETDPSNPDTDTDGALDGEDFWPTSKVFNGPPVQEMGYAVFGLNVSSLMINNAGQVAFQAKNATFESGSYFAESAAPDAPKTALTPSGFPSVDADSGIRLRYGPFIPVAVNAQGQVLAYCRGYYEWNPGVPGHSYPPTNGDGPYFFPGDSGYFWEHVHYEKNALWLGEGNQEIKLPGSFGFRPTPTSLNNVGAVLLNGIVVTPDYQTEPHPVVWLSGSYSDLGRGSGSKINNNGVVAGGRDNTAGVWRGSTFEPLASFNGIYSFATSLNDHDEIVGFSVFGWDAHACAWKGEEKLDLGTVTAGKISYAQGINDKSQIVGRTATAGVLWQNGRTTDLNDKISGTDWHITSANSINDTGFIVANAYRGNPQQTMIVLLIPAELVSDYNRDGKIDEKDRGNVTKDNPYRFWMNDDNDDGNTDGDDIPTGGGGNGIDTQVNGTRDLVDFFPVFLDIKRLLEILHSDKFDYSLACEDPFLNYVATDLRPETVRDYLTKLDSTTGELDSAGVLSNQPVTRIVREGHKLDTDFLDKIQNEGKGVILVEAWSRVTHPLRLKVIRRDTGELVTQVELPLSVDGAEKMYRHVNFLYADNAEGGRLTETRQPPNYPDNITSDKTFVFVHGYNVNPDQARGWNAQMFKSMWWSGSRAKFYGITWHGSESQVHDLVTVNYHLNVDNAFATARPLANVINNLGRNVTVVAHSLGNLVVASAIHDWGASVNNLFMVDSAIAIEAFDGESVPEPLMAHEDWYQSNRSVDQNYPERLWSSEWYQNTAFAVDDMRKRLTWRNRLRNITRATAYNFYSSGEEVLALSSSTTPTVIGLVGGELYNKVFGNNPMGEKVWALQEKLKGRTTTGEILGSGSGGWGFNQHWYVPIEGGIRPPTAEEAARLRDDQLVSDPLFIPGPADLHDENGSAYAADHRNTLLAEMIPARTPPAGGNRIPSFIPLNGTDRNYDMSSDTFQNGWPAERASSRWLHSDVTAVAYPFTWKVFDKFTNLADLNQ